MELIENIIDEKKYNLAYLLYKSTNSNNDSLFLRIIENIDKNLLTQDENIIIENRKKMSVNNNIKVLLCCSWTSSKNLCDLWNKMSKGNYIWENIQIVWEEPCDYYCVINQIPTKDIILNKKKTIIFRMEPHMETIPGWDEEWKNPSDKDFMFVGNHKTHFNNIEWHLSKTYNQLNEDIITKDDNLSDVLSSILSDKYNDPGHIKRIDFMKFLETKDIKLDIYGGNRFMWKNYKGSLPDHRKDDSLIPYKYTFNCENFSIKNFCTEKLIDAILSECLIFYSGCPNIKEIIDEKAYVYLELSNFEKDYNTIKKAISEDWHSLKLPYIKAEKKRILNELQFFPRLQKIIEQNKL
jgi:hypothetical protein